jgi:antitoxin PrlF
VDEQRRVYVKKVAEEVNDPLEDRFLEFLAQDMSKHPGTSVAALPASLRDRMAALVGDMDVDLDAGIDGDVAL